MPFVDRADAGRRLGRALSAYAGRGDVIVLGLPRGGVPVAAEVAHSLGAPLDVFLVRKLGVPGHEELAMGAIAEGGGTVVNKAVVDMLGIGDSLIRTTAEREEQELHRRQRQYRGTRSPPVVAGRTVIVVDDGLATGASMEAAVMALRQLGPAALIVAAPVAAADTCTRLRQVADAVVCLETPPDFGAVGQWYDDFTPTSDDEVRRLLGGGLGDRVS